MILSFITVTLMLIGTAFVLIAGLGVLRMGDFFTRLHAASKAAPFGITLLLIGVAVDAGSVGIAIRVVVIYSFLLATAPIAAHVIGRAAYLGGGRIESPAMDALEGKYDREARMLHSTETSEGRGNVGDVDDARHDPV